MILIELKAILSILENIRHSEFIADNMMEDECEEAIEIIKKEIKLKELDPRKD